MASSRRFSFLAASLAILLLAAASCAFARHRPDAASTAAVKPPKPLACAKSTLKDYSKSVKLAKNLFFHWNITDAKDGIIAALEDKTAGSGWISVGWTGSVGKMFPSDVVVGNHVSRFTGNTNDVLAYSWTGKTDWTFKGSWRLHARIHPPGRWWHGCQVHSHGQGRVGTSGCLLRCGRYQQHDLGLLESQAIRQTHQKG
ncbi:unnamed protein product [Closterium sp. Naga37s-1]|nr:unnamed protein product [Closterium sp. Naga37s-1]